MSRPVSFSQLPEVVKNLLIINGLFFLATISLESYGIDFKRWFALHQFQSPDFEPYQLITHFFMHANFPHLLFNMFMLWMFGKTLENVWGAKRFLIYYIITGLGAAMIYILFVQYQIYGISDNFPELLELAKEGKYSVGNTNSEKLSQLVLSPMVGASGAVYGLLLAFGMLFPNTLLYIYFAIPIKAKYVVMALGGIALFSGIMNNPADNIAHFAHLGGMIFGFILLKYWQKNNTQFY
jgi:membrane associated rhomboid family serine protease